MRLLRADRRKNHELRREWHYLSDEERESARNGEESVGDGNGNTVIPMTPKALAMLITALLALAGGGGSYVKTLIAGDPGPDHTKLEIIQHDVDTLKEQVSHIDRKLDRIIERNNEKDNR